MKSRMGKMYHRSNIHFENEDKVVLSELAKLIRAFAQKSLNTIEEAKGQEGQILSKLPEDVRREFIQKGPYQPFGFMRQYVKDIQTQGWNLTMAANRIK